MRRARREARPSLWLGGLAHARHVRDFARRDLLPIRDGLRPGLLEHPSHVEGRNGLQRSVGPLGARAIVEPCGPELGRVDHRVSGPRSEPRRTRAGIGKASAVSVSTGDLDPVPRLGVLVNRAHHRLRALDHELQPQARQLLHLKDACVMKATLE